jgi:hypothetical protein
LEIIWLSPYSRFEGNTEILLQPHLRIIILPDTLLCMRTTVDLPDSLMDRVKACLAKRRTG